MNVLVFPCGSEIGIEVYRALNGKKNIKLIGLSSADDHGRFVYENYIGGCPYITDKAFISHLKNVIEANNIDVIYPCMDNVLLKLKQHEKELCKVIGPTLDVVEICNSKRLTYQTFENIIEIPKRYESYRGIYPVFLKPDIGSGGQDCFLVEDEIEFNALYQPEHLSIEYLPGKEYTVDCFSHNGVTFAEGRERTRIFKGIAIGSKIVKDSRFKTIADKIYSLLPFNCAWFFQLKERSDGELVLLEMGARLGGSSCLNRLRGVNFALLNLYPADLEITIHSQDYVKEISRSLDAKAKIEYEFDRVYVDLDDTLIINGKVNYKLLAYLYKCKNEGKQIYLLTRSTCSRVTLDKYSISHDLFYWVIHVPANAGKGQLIKGAAILIDDSFRERNGIDIPVFDTDAIEAFL